MKTLFFICIVLGGASVLKAQHEDKKLALSGIVVDAYTKEILFNLTPYKEPDSDLFIEAKLTEQPDSLKQDPLITKKALNKSNA